MKHFLYNFFSDKGSSFILTRVFYTVKILILHIIQRGFILLSPKNVEKVSSVHSLSVCTNGKLGDILPGHVTQCHIKVWWPHKIVGLSLD